MRTAMGSKNLKAIAVRGFISVSIAWQKEYLDYINELYGSIYHVEDWKSWDSRKLLTSLRGYGCCDEAKQPVEKCAFADYKTITKKFGSLRYPFGPLRYKMAKKD